MITQASIEQFLTLAAKAPSAHNSQPWKVIYCIERQTIEVHLNDPYVPKISDSTKRQSIISVGCFLANLMVILHDNNYAFKLYVDEFSFIEAGCLAKIELLDTKVLQPTLPFDLDRYLKKGLSAQIAKRYNDRGAYVKEDISSLVNDVASQYLTLCRNMGLYLTVIFDQEAMDRLGGLTAKAMSMIFALDGSKEELRHFVAADEDETTTRRMQLSSLTESRTRSVDRWLNSPKVGQQESMFWKQAIESGPAILCISGETDLHQDWLLVGIALELLLLEFTALGYCHSIWASLIEIPPMVPQLQEVIGLDSRPLALFRVGRPVKPMRRTAQRANLSSFAQHITI